MSLTMFERLQQLPLLQGMSNNDIESFVFKVQLDFQQHIAGEHMAEQDENCKKLIYVINGELKTIFRDPCNNIVVTEYIKAPIAIEPYSMFGMRQRYTRDYVFETDGSTLVIPKNVFLNTLMDYPIIKTNMLNLVCNKMQQANNQLMLSEPASIKNKIIRLVRGYCLNDIGEKVIKIKMETMANIIGETRLNVSNTLKQLNNEGLISQQRNAFTVFDMRKFISA